MCGIAGVLRPDGVERVDLDRMIRSLQHRGPDGRGALVAGAVGFGHTRLAVIDPRSSTQPMATRDGRCWLTFNGELYNYRELAKELEREAPLSTRGDTEVLLRLLARDGTRALAKLRGMFAFGFYDFAERRLLLARDHTGQKPLYYWHDGERFAFASEIKALLALDASLAEIDPDALHEYLTLRIVTAPRSMFRRIRKLPPGHFLIFENGRVEIAPYWSLRFEPKHSMSFDEALEELDARLRDAVAHHLVSDVPVGAFLSGGMDSSLVTAMMRAVGGAPFPTFSGDVALDGRSEYPHAKLVADRLGLPNRRLAIEPVIARILPTVIRYLDEPADALSVCVYQLAELAARHVKVVLGGDGGDELFGGYDRYFGNRYVERYALLPEPLRQKVLGPLIARLSGGHWYRSVGHRLKWLHLLAGLDEPGKRYAKSLGYFYVSDEYRRTLYGPALLARASGFDPEERIAELHDSADAREALDRMVYADTCTRLPDHPLMILDRMTMAHGLEARSPFLDHRVAEHCARLPAVFKVRGTRLRVIEKALARRYLPAEILRRPKQGFSSPLFYALKSEFGRLREALLVESRLVEDGWLRSEGIARLVEDHIAGRADHAQRLWLLCAAEVWYRIRLRGEDAVEVEEAMLRRAA